MNASLLVAAVVSCGLVMPMAYAQDPAAPANPAMSMPMDSHTSQMHTNVTLMQTQMDKIHAATDPKERQKLMQAHMQMMQEGMTMMRSMSKPMTTDGGDMMKHHQMMMERMDMMQTMMEQMLQHQQMMESMPAK